LPTTPAARLATRSKFCCAASKQLGGVAASWASMRNIFAATAICNCATCWATKAAAIDPTSIF
jgi:hypothetical protein